MGDQRSKELIVIEMVEATGKSDVGCQDMWLNSRIFYSWFEEKLRKTGEHFAPGIVHEDGVYLSRYFEEISIWDFVQ